VRSARRWETKINQCRVACPGQLTHTFEHTQAAGNDCDSSRSRRRLPRTDARGNVKPHDHFQHSETDANLPGGSTGRGRPKSMGPHPPPVQGTESKFHVSSPVQHGSGGTVLATAIRRRAVRTRCVRNPSSHPAGDLESCLECNFGLLLL
jgi:hypothetical protein